MTRDVALSVLRGYMLAGSFVGYLVLFYLVGRKFFGVWLPAGSPYSNMLGTALPFLYPLLIGLTAAITEEFTYRFFAISFLRKYLRMSFLALLIPAVIWAFGHSTYPVYPVYVRGIELTIGGLIFGYFFVRYDLLTCIVAHYALDALLVGLPLLRSSNAYFLVSGVLVVLLGFLPALAGILRLSRAVKAIPAVGQ